MCGSTGRPDQQFCRPRQGKDGRPLWSARDLTDLFGYLDFRNFSEAIRRAREQVRSHIGAGHAEGADDRNFVNAERVVKGSAVPRAIPDVHLTRLAAYFVALNADQSKPESMVHDTPMRGCREQYLEAVKYNDFRGLDCE